jgi:hypothetical protein
MHRSTIILLRLSVYSWVLFITERIMCPVHILVFLEGDIYQDSRVKRIDCCHAILKTDSLAGVRLIFNQLAITAKSSTIYPHEYDC